MNTFRNLSAALLTTIIIGLLPTGATVAAEPVAAEPVPTPAQLTVINATPEQAETVTKAIAQFDAANLELPPLQIEFHQDQGACAGHSGLYRPITAERPAATDRIEMCTRLKQILLHELAHAWKHHNLDTETKDAFTTHWGLNSWNDKSDDHDDRAIERAANTIATTLNQTEATDSESITRYICGYELLTGSTLEIHTKIAC